MKATLKTILGCAVIAVLFVGCATTPDAKLNMEESELEQGQSEADANNVATNAEEMVILDWYGRADGEVAQPKWIRPLLRGNGTTYCSEYGLSETYANHKWLVSSERNASKATAQALTESEVMFAVGQEMSTSILGTVGQELNDGQKDAVRNICASTKATITGVGKRGEFWRKVKIVDDNGYKNVVYDYYTIYSCPKSTYNQLLNVYLIELIQNKGLDPATVNTLKKNAQQILDDAQEQSDRVERQRERELKAQLAHEETVQKESDNARKAKEAEERTNQVRSNNETIADVASSNANSSVARRATMNPALAALLK